MIPDKEYTTISMTAQIHSKLFTSTADKHIWLFTYSNESRQNFTNINDVIDNINKCFQHSEWFTLEYIPKHEVK